MKQCILILPYFGELKNYFNMFLNSCADNSEFDWLIISDNVIEYKAANIHIMNMSFDEFRSIIQNKFDFSISLKTPYKLCDFKPTYGYVLEEYIKDYRYWGHCDCDIIFGDMQKLLSPILKLDYEKIFTAGHLTIYKNTYENNRRFMHDLGGMYMYKIALSESEIFGFDEDYHEINVHSIFLNEKCKIYDKDLAFNVSPTYFNLYRQYYKANNRVWNIDKKTKIVYWTQGKILAINPEKKKINMQEYLYVHLHMRNMSNTLECNKKSCRIVKITPDHFEEKAKMISEYSSWIHEKKRYISLIGIVKAIKEIKYVLIDGKYRNGKKNPYKEFIIQEEGKR